MKAPMKALTVWQPWASLIAAGAKVIEYRGWPPPRHMREGTTFAIHAGMKRPTKADIRKTILYVEGIADPAIVNTKLAVEVLNRADEFRYGEIVAVVELAEVDKTPLRDRYRWHLRNIRPASSPPMRGYQQLWAIDPTLDVQVGETIVS